MVSSFLSGRIGSSVIFLPLGSTFILPFIEFLLPDLCFSFDVFQYLLARQEGLLSMWRRDGDDCDTSISRAGFIGQQSSTPMDGSPTGTIPIRWWTAQRTRDATYDEACSDRVMELTVSRTISVIVLSANFVYAWYSSLATVLPWQNVIHWARQLVLGRTLKGIACSTLFTTVSSRRSSGYVGPNIPINTAVAPAVSSCTDLMISCMSRV